MPIITTPPSENQRRQQELTAIVGNDRAVNADRSMNMMKHINRGLWTAIGMLVGGIIGKQQQDLDNPNATYWGIGAGGGIGLGTALLGEQLGKLKASLSLEKPNRKEIRQDYLDPSLTAYVIPGYSAYQQQRIEDMAYNRDLAYTAKKELSKKAAVFTEDDVKEMIAKADENKLRGREIFKRYTPKQITELANGVGPSWEPEWMARFLNFIMPWAKVSSTIHDLEWSEGTGKRREFDRSNERFLSNNKKMIGHPIYDPLRLTPELLYVAVQANRPHYVVGKKQNPYYGEAKATS